MNLLLMRHCEAAAREGDESDLQRSLTPRGRAAAISMGEVLRAHQLIPARVLVSPSRRTQETVEGLLSVLGEVEVCVLDRLYNADAMTILEVIHARGRGADPLLVVAHNPGLETTVSNIQGHIVPFPVGAVAQAVLTPGQESRLQRVWRPDEILSR